MLRLAIAGCNGRMGVALIQAAIITDGVKVSGATVSPHSNLINMDVGTIAGVAQLNLQPSDNLANIIDDFDILIDFTNPEASLAHLRLCQKYGKKIVIGTTGFNGEQKTIIQDMSEEIPIVFAPNTSVGVNLCYELLKQAAKTLGESADIEIIESHHRDKVDAPSGTALKMGEVICHTLKREMDEVAVYGRHGLTGPREKKTIGFSSIRAADIVGEHTVVFASLGERVEITHKATSRATFANGAIRAAKWLDSKQAGLYTMADVLFE